jgi:predicted  nucleic acid-binding Zn-ribbon protein
LNKDSLKSVVKKSIAPQVILGKKLKKRQLEQEKKLKRIEKKLNLFEKTVLKIKDQVIQYAQIFQHDLNLQQINKQFNGLNVEPELHSFQNEINSLKEETASLKDSISVKLGAHQEKVNTFYSRLDEIDFQNYRPTRIKRIY